MAVFRKRLEPHGIAVLTGSGDDNPYMGMLASADMIAVTTDSVSMISEAVATSAPVLVFPLPGRSSRISRFVKTLEDAGRVKWFDPAQVLWDVMPLDDTPSWREKCADV